VTLPEPDARVADEAAFGFGRAFPGQSARIALRPSQVVIARRILVLAGLAGLLAPLAAVSILMWLGLILFAAILAFRVALVLIGCLPARGRSRPIALGGTSNHFRRDRLVEAGTHGTSPRMPTSACASPGAAHASA